MLSNKEKQKPPERTSLWFCTFSTCNSRYCWPFSKPHFKCLDLYLPGSLWFLFYLCTTQSSTCRGLKRNSFYHSEQPDNNKEGTWMMKIWFNSCLVLCLQETNTTNKKQTWTHWKEKKKKKRGHVKLITSCIYKLGVGVHLKFWISQHPVLACANKTDF